MVLVLLKTLRYPVVPDRVQKMRKHKNNIFMYYYIFSNFFRHFRNVCFRGEKVLASLEWSTCDDLPSGFHEITKNLENQ